MPSSNRVGEVLARVEGATDFDRELDRDIGFIIDGWERSGDKDDLIYVPFEATYYPDHPGAMYPSFTESIDAALALVERKLPGWACGFDGGPKTCIGFVDPHDYADRFIGARHTATAANPALAIIAALLRALADQETDTEKTEGTR